MRKIRQALVLHFEKHYSQRQICLSLGVSRGSLSEYLVRFSATGLDWADCAQMTEEALEAKLYRPFAPFTRRPTPNWSDIQAIMQQKGATLQVLHEEYLAEHPDGMSYSRFCTHYRQYLKTLKRSMRQIYLPGEKLFVDYAGPTVPIADPATGQYRTAQIFVGVLGASGYIYAQANWSQSLENWIDAHVRMFAHLGGVPKVIVCDNLKSAVTVASRTDPVVNETYQAMASQYGTLILPARAYKPKDKAKAENGVLIVERWLLFRLRKRVFHSLTALNEAIAGLLVEINQRPFQKKEGSRQSLLEILDRPALQALPETPYEFAEYRRARVGPDYCIQVDGCAYSVPWQFSGKEVEVRRKTRLIEIYYRGQPIASHPRSEHQATVINPAHMAPNHRYFGEWSDQVALIWAEAIGAPAKAFLQILLSKARIREQGYRAHQAMKGLVRDYGDGRVNRACERALEIGAQSMSSLKSILRNRLDAQDVGKEQLEARFDHDNVRGADYYR